MEAPIPTAWLEPAGSQVKPSGPVLLGFSAVLWVASDGHPPPGVSACCRLTASRLRAQKWEWFFFFFFLVVAENSPGFCAWIYSIHFHVCIIFHFPCDCTVIILSSAGGHSSLQLV